MTTRTSRNEDLVGTVCCLCSILASHLDFVLREEASPAFNIINLVISKVPFVNAVETLDISVALRLEPMPVKAIDLGVEAVAFRRLGQGFCHCCGIPHDLLRDTSIP